MLQRGGVWLVGVAVVVGCGGPREAPFVDTRQHAFVPHLVRAGARTGMLSPDDGAFSSFGRIAWSGSELGVVYEDARHGDQHHDAYFARLRAVDRVLRVPGEGVQ